MTTELTEDCLFIPADVYDKILFMRDVAKAEVGFYGISEEDDLLHLEDIQLPKQKVSVVTVDFDDAGLLEYADRMEAKDIDVARSTKIWMHTHPGPSPDPSRTDEQTFARLVSQLDMGDWMIMYILGTTGKYYCRQDLKHENGIFQREMDVEIGEWDIYDEWRKEYESLVTIESSIITYKSAVTGTNKLIDTGGTSYWPSEVTDSEYIPKIYKEYDVHCIDDLDLLQLRAIQLEHPTFNKRTLLRLEKAYMDVLISGEEPTSEGIETMNDVGIEELISEIYVETNCYTLEEALADANHNSMIHNYVEERHGTLTDLFKLELELEIDEKVDIAGKYQSALDLTQYVKLANIPKDDQETWHRIVIQCDCRPAALLAEEKRLEELNGSV